VPRLLRNGKADASQSDNAELPVPDLGADHEVERKPLPVSTAHDAIALDDAAGHDLSLDGILSRCRSMAHPIYPNTAASFDSMINPVCRLFSFMRSRV